MIVVFVFLQGFRATIIPMLAIPVSLVATFAVMAAFGFSINSLTLCGLVLAIGLVVDDAIIVVENVEKYLHRGLPPLEATRAAMAEITTPIVTITLVLAAVFVPVAFMPGMTGKLYNQFAMTIVFSFVFSAFNSLTFSPAMARLFLRAEARRDAVLPVPLVQRGAAAGSRIPTTRCSSGRPTTGGRSSSPSVVLLGLTGWMIAEPAQGVHPDRGPGLPDLRGPDARRHQRREDAAVIQRVEAICRGEEGVKHTVALEGLNVITSTNQTNCGVVFAPLEDWHERTTPELRAAGAGPEAPGEARPRSATPW